LLDGEVGRHVGDRVLAVLVGEVGVAEEAEEDDAVLQKEFADGVVALPLVVAALRLQRHRQPGAGELRRRQVAGRDVVVHGGSLDQLWAGGSPSGGASAGLSSPEALSSGGASAVGSCISPGTACSSTVATVCCSCGSSGTSSYSALARIRSSASRSIISEARASIRSSFS